MRTGLPVRLQLRLRVPAQRGAHRRAGPQGPLSGQQGSRSRRHDRRRRGRDRPQDQLLRDGQPQRLQGPGRRGRRRRASTSRAVSRCSATTDAYKNVYIEPGKQKLNGQEALWYARSRVQSDDYARMGRQKCLMAAMVAQLSPHEGADQRDVKIAELGQGPAQHEHPAAGAGPVRRPRAQGARRQDPHRLDRAAGVQHRGARLPGDPRRDPGRDQEVRRPRAQPTATHRRLRPRRRRSDDTDAVSPTEGRAANNAEDLDLGLLAGLICPGPRRRPG